MPLTRHSWGLTALAATSGIGAWLVWKALYVPSRYRSSNKKKLKKAASSKKQSTFDFIVTAGGSRSLSEESERSTTSTATTVSCSTLGEDEIKEVWESGDVNLKILRHLLQAKEARRRGKRLAEYSKLNLCSHLLTRLETTLDEQNRIETKLLRMQQEKAQPLLALPPSTTSIPKQPSNNNHNNSTVCMVVQRYRGATLLCEESEIVRVGASTAVDQTPALLQPNNNSNNQEAFCGLLIYVSFAQGCTQQAVKAAAKIVVNLPLLTLGGWGDGVSKTMNVIDLAKQHPSAASITIVPQANLINKIKSQGKSIQYHGQIDKQEGNALYHYFVNSVRGLVLEQQCQWRDQPLPSWYSKACSAQAGTTPERVSPSIPPEELFRQKTSLYKSWDDNGIPLTDAEDEPITKSAQKKLRKAQAAHRVRHLRYLQYVKNRGGEQQQLIEHQEQNNEQPQQPPQQHWATAIDPSFVHVVAGTFGKRQSLEFVSSMGPLCHVVQRAAVSNRPEADELLASFDGTQKSVWSPSTHKPRITLGLPRHLHLLAKCVEYQMHWQVIIM